MEKKSKFLEMHDAVGGSYSSQYRVQAEKDQIDQKGPTTGAVKNVNQLLTVATERQKPALRQKKIDQLENWNTPESAESREQELSNLNQKLSSITYNRSPSDFQNDPEYQNTVDKIQSLENGEKELRESIARLNTQLAPSEIAALPEEDRKALENYVVQRKNDWYDTLLQGIGGNGVIGTPGGRAETQAAALAEKYGWDKVKYMAETLERQQNAQATELAAQEGAEIGQEHPFLGSVASIPMNVVSGIPATFERIRNIGNATGGYPTLDPNNAGNLLGTMGSSIQGQVASNIEGDSSNPWRKAGSYVYRGGMSALESGLRAATGKAGTVLLSGLGSFEQNVSKASAQGASPEKAVTLGLTNAAIEALSEEISLDHLLDAAKGGKQSFIKALGLALAQAGIEASTEEVSLIGTTLAEAAILKDKSEYSQYIQSRMAEGADYQTALNEVFQDLLQEAADTAIVSGISGAGMSGFNSIMTNISANTEAKKQENAQTATQSQTDANATVDTDTQQVPQQTTETPLQGEPADPRHVAAQQEQATQAQPVAQQNTAIREDTTPSNAIMDTMLDPIGQEQTQPNPALETLSPYPTQDTAQPQQVEIDPLLEGIQQPPVAEQVTDPQPQSAQPMQQTAESSSTAINTNPETHTAGEQAVIDAYQASVDENLVEYIEAVQNNQGGKMPKYPLNNVSERAASDIKQLTGVDVAGNKVQIESRIIEHILKDHGENGISDHSMRDINDIARIQYVIDNYDSIEHGGTSSAYVYQNQNGRNAQAQTVVMKKKVNGTYFVVEAVPDTKKKTVYINSAYMSKDGAQKAAGSLSGDANAPRVTSQNATKNPTASVDSILNDSENVNGNNSTLGMQSAPSGDSGMSKTYTNTGVKSADAAIEAAYKREMQADPLAAEYEAKHNKDVLETAKARTATMEQVTAEADYLTAKENWTSEDNVTAELAIAELMRNGKEGAPERIFNLQEQRKLINSRAGQLVKSNSIIGTMRAADSPQTAADAFFNSFTNMEEKDTTYNPKNTNADFKTWKKEIITTVDQMALSIDQVAEGDTASMKAIIRDIANQRGTTAWFGTQQRLPKSAELVLNKLNFSDLKTIANTQIATMADDFRRRTAKEVIGSTRKQSMLSALTTFSRNIGGNATGGLLDSASESTTGRIADGILSKFTGKKTVGSDITQVGSYVKGAKDAMAFASLCVELNIPVETDAASSLNVALGGDNGAKYVGKTFRPKGNIVMRAMYGYQKFLNYNLEVTDKIFEGGTKSAVSDSLAKLNNSGLTSEDIQNLSEFSAKKRTFKNATWKDSDGRTHGAVFSRLASKIKSAPGKGIRSVTHSDNGSIVGKSGGLVADVVDIAVDSKIPFVEVASNLVQTGSDYTPTGIIKSVGEIASIIIDSHNGIEIPVERQRQAASDFGRGVSGLVLVGLAAAGARAGYIVVFDDDDKDKQGLATSEGRNGVAINWSAIKRDIDGVGNGSTEVQDTDVLTNLDFLEPYDTQLYLGSDLAQEEDFWSAVKHYPGNAFTASLNAFMDSPAVQGLQGLVDDFKEVLGSETPGEEAVEKTAESIGEYVSSFEPQFVRQIAQAADGYYRDTRGQTPVETAVNQVMYGIPGLSQKLPVKVNGLGEPQKRGSWGSILIDSTKTHKVQKNEVTTHLDSLSEQTGDKSFYPEYRAPMSITVDGEKISLDGTQRVTYQTAYGNTYNRLTSELMKDTIFNAMSPEIQGEIINRVRDIATQAGKASISENVDAPVDTAQGIIRNEVKSKFGKAYDTLVDSLDNGGDSASGSQALDQAYSLYTTLSADEQKAFRDENGGRIGYFLTAKEADISTEQFADLYSTYRTLDNNEDISAKEKAQQWSSTLAKAQKSGNLTKAQANTLKDSMVFRTASVAKSEKFDNLVESGMSTETADKITHLLDGIKGTGKDGTVRPIDKYSAIAGSSLSTKDKETALYEYMPDAMDEKYTYAKKNMTKNGRGITVDDFVAAYKVTDKYSLKEDQKKAWEAMGYTETEAENLWKLYEGKLT